MYSLDSQSLTSQLKSSYVLGLGELGEFDSFNTIQFLIFIIFSFFIPLLLLNLLIAIMSDGYEKI